MAAVAPVRETTRENDFGFPFNIRATLAVWKALFLDKTPFRPDPSKDAAWNEGGYLVEGLGHCAACHSPRNSWVRARRRPMAAAARKAGTRPRSTRITSRSSHGPGSSSSPT
jgi:Cytochrome c, mono- and diheme variants